MLPKQPFDLSVVKWLPHVFKQPHDEISDSEPPCGRWGLPVSPLLITDQSIQMMNLILERTVFVLELLNLVSYGIN